MRLANRTRACLLKSSLGQCTTFLRFDGNLSSTFSIVSCSNFFLFRGTPPNSPTKQTYPSCLGQYLNSRPTTKHDTEENQSYHPSDHATSRSPLPPLGHPLPAHHKSLSLCLGRSPRHLPPPLPHSRHSNFHVGLPGLQRCSPMLDQDENSVPVYDPEGDLDADASTLYVRDARMVCMAVVVSGMPCCQLGEFGALHA